jgi:hypothetical protein
MTDGLPVRGTDGKPVFAIFTRDNTSWYNIYVSSINDYTAFGYAAGILDDLTIVSAQ